MHENVSEPVLYGSIYVITNCYSHDRSIVNGGNSVTSVDEDVCVSKSLLVSMVPIELYTIIH